MISVFSIGKGNDARFVIRSRLWFSRNPFDATDTGFVTVAITESENPIYSELSVNPTPICMEHYNNNLIYFNLLMPLISSSRSSLLSE